MVYGTFINTYMIPNIISHAVLYAQIILERINKVALDELYMMITIKSIKSLSIFSLQFITLVV